MYSPLGFWPMTCAWRRCCVCACVLLLDLKCLTFIWIVNKNKRPQFVYISALRLLLLLLLSLPNIFGFSKKCKCQLPGMKVERISRNLLADYYISLGQKWVSWFSLFLIKFIPHIWHLFFLFSAFSRPICAFLNFVTHCDQISRNCKPRKFLQPVLSDKY